MGFFDFIFGKKATTASPPVSPPAKPTWRQRLAVVHFDWENPDARRLVGELLTEAAPHFGHGQVKEMHDDENIDLRGTFDGAPVRFAIWMSFGTFWAIQMRCPHALADFALERDHEKIPKHADADDPWSAAEERRIFVAKGIFFEGSDDEVAAGLDRWAKLPDPLKDRILVDMERLDCNEVRAGGQEISIHQRPGLRDLDDPIAYMKDCAELMAELKNGGLTADDAEPSTLATEEPRHIAGIRITCAFCSTMYLQTPTHHNCPNCGAPPRG